VQASVALPGSKSMTNRALVLAALSDGPSQVRRPLRARDTVLMAGALRSLGTSITDRGDDWLVIPAAMHGPARVDCGLAGTVMRFLPPVAALATGPIRFDGDPRARERPMARLIEAMRALGVVIGDAGRATLPFTVEGTGRAEGGGVNIDASASSQFVSALLLAGARYARGVDVRHDGPPVPSLPHVQMTVAMLRARGVGVAATEPNRWVVAPGPIGAVDVEVEPDLSNAGPFLAAALVTGGSVTVRGWPRVTDQAGDRWRGLLAQLGAVVERSGDDLTVRGTGRITGIDVDLHEIGELTPVLAAVCALADTPSYLRGIAHLRGHETDRLAAIVAELNGLGGDVAETADGLRVRPTPLHGGGFRSHGDHRMAQAAAVLGLVVAGVQVEDVASTAKTHPDFPTAWESLLG